MSRFSEEDAVALIQIAVRRRRGQTREEAEATAPLRGKEATLLAALRDAEQAHEDAGRKASAEAERVELLRLERKKHRQFRVHISAALVEWQGMDENARLGLAWCAHARGVSGQAWDDSSNYLAPIVDRFNTALNEMARAVDMAADDIVFAPGARRGISQSVGSTDVQLAPLHAFVRKLSEFWRVTTGQKVTAQFGPRDPTAEEVKSGVGLSGKEPKSAAAKLMVAATAKFKDESGNRLYSIGAVETAMRSLGSLR